MLNLMPYYSGTSKPLTQIPGWLRGWNKEAYPRDQTSKGLCFKGTPAHYHWALSTLPKIPWGVWAPREAFQDIEVTRGRRRLCTNRQVRFCQELFASLHPASIPPTPSADVDGAKSVRCGYRCFGFEQSLPWGNLSPSPWAEKLRKRTWAASKCATRARFQPMLVWFDFFKEGVKEISRPQFFWA